MRRFLSLVFLICIAFNVLAQDKDEVLITIEDRSFTKNEFVRIYEKNNTNLLNDSEKKTPKDYLELFINYKLKVIEAENLKMDTSRAFIEELEGYRKELAAPYLTDVSYNKKMVEETYLRMKTEIKASHLLIQIADNQSPADTLEAYTKILEIRKEIINGLDFKEAAFKYSTDPSAKNNKGELGYFSAFQMVFPFEEAAFNTPVGEVSFPVRSKYGYHLINVEDKRAARGEIKVAHIMKTFPQNPSEEIIQKLKSEIDSIYSELKKGADFAEMAKKHSDDKNSSSKGGEMAWFNSGIMIADFANPAFAIEKIGDISAPIRTRFGYHIIKKLDQRDIKEFDEAKNDINNRIKRDPARSSHSKEAFIKKLKNEYNFHYNDDVYNGFKNNTYKLSLKNKLVGQNILDAEFININGKGFTTKTFMDFVNNKYPNKPVIKEAAFEKYFNEWIEKVFTDYEDAHLEEKYPEFRNLLQEYHDGILLFNISDELIWSYAVKDSAGFHEYYEKNKSTYLWDERFKGLIIKCIDQETRDEVEKYFAAGMTKQDILDEVNKEKEKVWIKEGAWEKNANTTINFYVWNGAKPDNFNEELEFIRGDLIEPEPKSLNEARGLYLSDYQNYLEKEWIKDLRKKYKIKVNKKQLRKINDA